MSDVSRIFIHKYNEIIISFSLLCLVCVYFILFNDLSSVLIGYTDKEPTTNVYDFCDAHTKWPLHVRTVIIDKCLLLLN